VGTLSDVVDVGWWCRGGGGCMGEGLGGRGRRVAGGRGEVVPGLNQRRRGGHHGGQRAV